MVEQCYKLSKTVVNPIIDWTDEDVWEFIHEYEVPYCKLYDEGHKRLGCIGCPMVNTQEREMNKYPKYKKAYMKAFKRLLETNEKRGIECTWKNAQEVYDWWVKA